MKKITIKDKIGAIVLTIVFSLAAKSCITEYTNGGDKTSISNYEQIVTTNTHTTATFQSEYEEETIKIAHIPMKFYHFKYDFTVDGRGYTGKVTLSSVPTQPTIEVYYLQMDPNFNCTDPKRELEKEKEKNTSKTDLYFGIFWSILALLGIVAIVGLFIKEKEVVTIKSVVLKSGDTLKNAYQIQHLKNEPIILDIETKENINRMSKEEAVSFCCKRFNLTIKEAKTFVRISKSLK